MTDSIYSADGVVLYRGDCRSVLPSLPDESAALVLVDLPYGQTRNEWDRVIPMRWMWQEIHRLTPRAAPAVLFAQGMFGANLMRSNRSGYRYSWVWEKDRVTGFLNAKRAPLRSHEDVHVFCRRGAPYHPQMTTGRPNNSRGSLAGPQKNSTYGKFEHREGPRTDQKYPRSTLYFPCPFPAIYPCEKPVALLECLIKTYTQPGDLVLDFCCGSGPTLEAARRTGRRAVGVELTEQGCELTVQRLTAEGQLEIPAA